MESSTEQIQRRIKENNSQSEKLKEKFVFFTISLVLGILALSVQTAKFGQHDIADIIELLSWCLLVLSAYNGLNSVPSLYNMYERYANWLMKAESSDVEALQKHVADELKYRKRHIGLMYIGIMMLAFGRMIKPVWYLIIHIFSINVS